MGAGCPLAVCTPHEIPAPAQRGLHLGSARGSAQPWLPQHWPWGGDVAEPWTSRGSTVSASTWVTLVLVGKGSLSLIHI